MNGQEKRQYKKAYQIGRRQISRAWEEMNRDMNRRRRALLSKFPQARQEK